MRKRAALITAQCDGGCGKIEHADKRSVRSAVYYVCSPICEAKLPALAFGSLRVSDYEAFGTFTGITDRPPTGVERSLIEKAMAQLGIQPWQIGNLDL